MTLGANVTLTINGGQINSHQNENSTLWSGGAGSTLVINGDAAINFNTNPTPRYSGIGNIKTIFNCGELISTNNGNAQGVNPQMFGGAGVTVNAGGFIDCYSNGVVNMFNSSAAFTLNGGHFTPLDCTNPQTYTQTFGSLTVGGGEATYQINANETTNVVTVSCPTFSRTTANGATSGNGTILFAAENLALGSAYQSAQMLFTTTAHHAGRRERHHQRRGQRHGHEPVDHPVCDRREQGGRRRRYRSGPAGLRLRRQLRHLQQHHRRAQSSPPAITTTR